MRLLHAALLALLALSRSAQASRVIALPLCGAPSHVFIMWKVCRELASRGHDILLVAAESDSGALASMDWGGMRIETYSAAFNQSEWRAQAHAARFKDPVQGGLEGIRMWGAQCDLLLSDKPLLGRLKDFGADVLFGDWGYFCTPALSETLRLPRVTVSNIPMLDPLPTSWDRSTGRRMHAPNVLAYTPQVGTGLPSPMSFAQRVQNVVTYAAVSLIDYFAFHRAVYVPLSRKHGLDLGTPEALARGVMHLFNVDFALEYPRALPPNVKFVGPLMPEPAQALPADLQGFVEGAGEAGVVYVSLGTVCSVGEAELRELARALSGLPCRVIWKVGAADLPDGLTMAALGLGSNIKVVSWAPQNDVLGHPSTRAFLTHGGINGLYEAAYHGVPIAGIPLIADQLDNVMKAVHRGFGLAISPKGGLKAGEIGTALRRLLEEPGFAAAAGKLRRRLRSRPRTPAQEAADWVEHVLDTDGEAYLQTPEDGMPLVSLLLLDVFAFLIVIATLPVIAVCAVWQRIWRRQHLHAKAKLC